MRTLLIDADIVTYRVASVIEKPIHWGGGLWTLHSDFNEGKFGVDGTLDTLKEALETENVIICLTDKENFRNEIYPQYKQNRAGKRRPLVLQELKDYLTETYPSFVRPGLEADDIMGILQTSDKIVEGETIICTVDKDLNSIPGKIVHLDDPYTINNIDTHSANYAHLYQTLVGDTSDGYPGCKGVGPKKADTILGPYVSEDGFDVQGAWEDVVAAFDKAGFGEEEALTQARVARILRNIDYNFKTKEVIPWTP